MKAGYQIDYDVTSGRDYTYWGHRFSVGGQYTLPWRDIRLKYDFDVHLRTYRFRSAILPSVAPDTSTRQDEEMTHNFRVEYPVPYSAQWACGPWGSYREKTDKCLTVSADYQGSRASSTIAVFDFARNVFSLILSWAY